MAKAPDPAAAKAPGKPGDKEAGGKKAKKAKKSKKKLIIIVVVVLLVGGLGYKMTAKKPVVVPKGPVAIAGGPTVVEDSLTVNLRDDHYLQFTPALQFAFGKSAKALNAYTPQVTDILIAEASAMTETELLTAQGPQELKANIIRALDRLWPGLVVAVYFEQFVMQ
jgi:flagellar FliL protein